MQKTCAFCEAHIEEITDSIYCDLCLDLWCDNCESILCNNRCVNCNEDCEYSFSSESVEKCDTCKNDYDNCTCNCSICGEEKDDCDCYNCYNCCQFDNIKEEE
jgi:hypothetical protein